MDSWLYNNKEVNSLDDTPEGSIGFVYVITDPSGKIYVGQKSLFSRRKRKFGKKEVAELADKRLKTYEYIIKEGQWRDYTGSNKELNELIKSGAAVKREILHWCFTKKQLSYYEIKEICVRAVIEPNSNAYNGNLLGRYYRKDLLD